MRSRKSMDDPVIHVVLHPLLVNKNLPTPVTRLNRNDGKHLPTIKITDGSKEVSDGYL